MAKPMVKAMAKATAKALILTLLAFTASAQTATSLHGVYLGDIDKNANACTDFFQYANGSWRAANPIPASMARGSRRWAAGEQNKDQLKTILNDESTRHDWPKGSIRSEEHTSELQPRLH